MPCREPDFVEDEKYHYIMLCQSCRYLDISQMNDISYFKPYDEKEHTLLKWYIDHLMDDFITGNADKKEFICKELKRVGVDGYDEILNNLKAIRLNN